MTTSAVFWEGSSGDWFDPAHWNTGVIPGAADDTNIDAPGSYTVTLTAPATVASLTIAAFSATLDIADPGGIETIAGGLSNSGIVEVDASSQGGTTVSIGGALTNDGRFTVGNGTLSVPTTVSAAGLTDTGTITIEGAARGRPRSSSMTARRRPGRASSISAATACCNSPRAASRRSTAAPASICRDRMPAWRCRAPRRAIARSPSWRATMASSSCWADFSRRRPTS